MKTGKAINKKEKNTLNKTSKTIQKVGVKQCREIPSTVSPKTKSEIDIKSAKKGNSPRNIQGRNKNFSTSEIGQNVKTDWNQLKKDKKQLKFKRKEGKYKELSILIREAKIMYEKLKCKSTEKKKKDELSEGLFRMLVKNDCIHKFVLAHDTSRIIQCLLKHLPPSTREELSLAVLPVSIIMMQSRYAHFCVVRMLKYGSKITKTKLIESMYGSVVKLCSHNISAKIMDFIYFERATKNQKICLKQEFYSDLFTSSKDLNIKHLNQTYSAIQNSKKFVLECVRNKLTHLINKNIMDNSLVHDVLLEYVEEYYESGNNEENDEFLKLCINIIPQLISTKNGTKSAIYIFWLSQTKERRAILKVIRDFLLKICLHEHGHKLILAILNSLDDTKAIKKSVFDILVPHFNEIIESQHGRKVLCWFISPADNEIYDPNLIKFLDEGLVHSKKDKILRRKEIFELIEESLCREIENNTQIWLSNGKVGLIISAFLKHISIDRCTEIYNCLCKEITSTTWKTNDCEKFAIEDNGLHYVLKRILKRDHARVDKTTPSFAEELLQNIGNDTLNLWISKNRGCFVLVLLFEALNEAKQKELRSLLISHMENLEGLSHSGSQILIKKIR